MKNVEWINPNGRCKWLLPTSRVERRVHHVIEAKTTLCVPLNDDEFDNDNVRDICLLSVYGSDDDVTECVSFRNGYLFIDK